MLLPRWSELLLHWRFLLSELGHCWLLLRWGEMVLSRRVLLSVVRIIRPKLLKPI